MLALAIVVFIWSFKRTSRRMDSDVRSAF